MYYTYILQSMKDMKIASRRLGGRKEGYWEIDVVPEEVENLEKDTLRHLKMQHYKDIVIWKH